MLSSPPPLPSEKPQRAFFHHAATCCLFAPLIAIALNAVAMSARDTPEIFSIVSLLAGIIMLVGFALGIVSLFGISTHGKKGILGRALSGLAIYLLLFAVAIPNFLRARERARNRANELAYKIKTDLTLRDTPLLEARRKHPTKLIKKSRIGEPTPVPPEKLFRLEQYESNLGPMDAYVGGHSTGGTMVLLATASSTEFRAVFSLRPVGYTANYGQEHLTFNVNDDREGMLRAPAEWLHQISTPTFAFEGTSGGNVESLNYMAENNRGSAKFYPVENQDHFSIIAPLSRFLATKILTDTNSTPSITIAEQELKQLSG